MLFPTNANQVQAFAGALYGVQVGSVTMAQVTSDITSGGGLNAVLNRYYSASFGSMTTTAVATTFATNLGLTGESLTEGIAYTVARLNAVSADARGAEISAILNLFTTLTADATFGTAATAWTTKVGVAAAYTGTTNVAIGTVVVPDAVAGVFTLTAGVDSGATFVGGALNDTFNADLTAGGANTLNALDRIDGGGGIDTFNVVLATDVTPASLANIEAIVATGIGARAFGLTNAAQATSVTSNGSTGILTFTGIAAGANLAVQSQAVGADFQYTTTVGTQSANLGVSAVTAAAPITVDGVETIAVTATGAASTYQLDADSVTSLSFAGTANQTVTLAAMTGVSHFNAAQTTGNFNITLTNQTGLLSTTDATVTGGSGNDTITVTAHTQSDVSLDGGAGNDTFVSTAWAITDSVNGGDGTADVISMNNASAVTLGAAARTTFTNLEQLTISDHFDQGAGLTVANISTGISTVNLTHTSAAAVPLTDEDETIVGGAGTMTINLGGNLANNVGVLGAAFTVTDTGTATTDTLVLNNVARDAGANLNVFAGNSITSNGYENVVISTGSGTGNAEQDIATLTITPDAVSANVSLTVSGPSAFHIDTSLTTTSTGLMTVNASGLTAQAPGTASLTIDATSQGTGGTASITGSAGDDLITVGAFASTIIGGAGNDTLNGGAGADNIQGGDGIDTITDGGGNDTISGGAGNDVITISGTSSVNVDAGEGDDLVDMNAVLSAGDIVNGGAGTDTLAIDAAVTAESSQGVTNFEILRADTALTQDMVQFTTNGGFTRVIANNNGTTVFNNVAAATTEARSVTAVAVTVDRLLDNTTNALTFGAQGNATATITTLTVDDEETFNITAGGITTANTALTITDLHAEDLVTLNISGVANVTITNAIQAQAVAGLTTVNASANTGTVNVSAGNATLALTMTGSATAASTLTGGTGNDVINGGSAADSLVGGNGADSITGGGGADTLIGGAGADTLVGGEGADVLNGGTGQDVFVLTETTSAIDTVIISTVVGGVSDSAAVINAGFDNDTGVDTITGITWGTDVIRVVATAVVDFVHGDDTAIGTQTGDLNDGTVGSFVTGVGLINTNGNASFADSGDIAINFTSPSAALTEARFEAALQYHLTGTAAANTITGGALADTIDGGAGADRLTGGAGIDTFIDLGLQGESIVSSAATLTATVAATDTITFATTAPDNVDRVLDFQSIDLLDITGVTPATVPTDIVGLTAATALADGVAFVGYGTYVPTTGVFSLAAAFNAVSAHDAILIVGDGAATLVTTTGSVIFNDLTVALGAANFV